MKLTFKKLKASVDNKTWEAFSNGYANATFKRCSVLGMSSTTIDSTNVKVLVKGKLLVIKGTNFQLDSIQTGIEEIDIDHLHNILKIYTKDGLTIKLF